MGFDPASLMIGSMVLGGIGAGVNAYGAAEGGEAKAAAASYQAQVAANNAQIAQQDARLDIQAGEVRAFNQSMRTRAAVGQEKAAQGAAGIDVNTGSAADVRTATTELGIVDASTIRANASKEAYAKEVEAMSDTAQGQLLKTEAQQDQEAGYLSAAGTLLNGASTVGGQWAKYKTLYG